MNPNFSPADFPAGHSFFAPASDANGVSPGRSFFAPANIALIKYWGKRDGRLNLPTNSSLSLGLGALGTRTAVQAAARDEFILNGEALPLDGAFARKVFHFIELWEPRRPPLRIISHNSIPTGAGLASSASGFAALTRALNHFFHWELGSVELSRRARRGSGSACRSLWPGFVLWRKGEAADGSDSYGLPLAYDWPTLRLAILPVDLRSKGISSRDGMNHTVATSPLYSVWAATAADDLLQLEAALAERDFASLGAVAEGNALAMHATMLAARPALCYLQPQSLDYLRRLWAARAEGLAAYATIDAGANIKLIFEEASGAALRQLFPEALLVNPWEPVAEDC